MKRAFWVVLLLVLAFSLSACGDEVLTDDDQKDYLSSLSTLEKILIEKTVGNDTFKGYQNLDTIQLQQIADKAADFNLLLSFNEDFSITLKDSEGKVAYTTWQQTDISKTIPSIQSKNLLYCIYNQNSFLACAVYDDHSLYDTYIKSLKSYGFNEDIGGMTYTNNSGITALTVFKSDIFFIECTK